MGRDRLGHSLIITISLSQIEDREDYGDNQALSLMALAFSLSPLLCGLSPLFLSLARILCNCKHTASIIRVPERGTQTEDSEKIKNFPAYL